MGKLLSAALYRSLRHPVVWVLPLLNIVFGMLFVSDGMGDPSHLVVPLTSIAVYIALSIGREHGEGTLRNKIVAGHTKGQIFLSECVLNLCVAAVLAVCFCFGALIMVLIGWKTVIFSPASVLWRGALITLFSAVALSVLLTAICMLITQWAISAIIGVLLVFGLMGGALAVGNALYDSPTYEEAVWENGEIVETRIVENPFYIGGAARVILTAVQRANPWGQFFIACDVFSYYEYGPMPFDGANTPENVSVFHFLPLYSLGLAAVSCGVGYAFFCRKDLK